MSGCEYLGKIQRFLNNIISTKIGKKNPCCKSNCDFGRNVLEIRRLCGGCKRRCSLFLAYAQ